MSILSDLYNRNWGGGNWQKRFGIEGNLLATDTFNQAWGGGKWMTERMNPATLTEDLPEYLTSTAKWYNQLGGREFDEAWGGGAWMDPGKRNFLGLDEKGNIPWTNINLFKVDKDNGDDGNGENGGDGDGEADTSIDAEKLARGFDLGSEQSEKDRLARMRRMLAGRYGRAETNLTGGTGFGSGSQRTLGGFS